MGSEEDLYDIYADPFLEEDDTLSALDENEDPSPFTAVSRSVTSPRKPIPAGDDGLSPITGGVLFRTLDTSLTDDVEAAFEREEGEEEPITLPEGLSITIPEAMSVSKPSAHTVSFLPSRLHDTPSCCPHWNFLGLLCGY